MTAQVLSVSGVTGPADMCSNQVTLQGEQCKYYSYMFYQAVRDQEPMWKLEEMRTMEYFHSEEDASMWCYSPSDAMMYAVVHNHLRYAHYMLSHFPEEALKGPGIKICCCRPAASHLAQAVTYDRRDILIMIIKISHELPSLQSYINRASCFHLSDGKTPLHMACELLSAETVLILLGNGGSPQILDRNGETPLDIILEQLWSSKVNVQSKKLCLHYLLLFSSSLNFKMRKILQDNPKFWTLLLGEEQFDYLVGNTPATLYMTSMQRVLRCLTPSHFPQSIQALPIAHALKPLPGPH